MAETTEQPVLYSRNTDSSMNATSLTGASPVNPEAQTSAMADTYSTIAHGGPTESSNIGSDHVKESTSDEFKSKTEIDRESVDPKKAVDNIISEPSDRAELENKQFAGETTETPTEKAINDVQLRQSDIQEKPSSPAATEPEKTALKPTEVEDEKLTFQPTASNISDEVTAGASALVSPGSSQQPLDKGCHSEPAVGNREIKPSEKIYKENLHSIETIHSDGTVSVVPAHPPSAETDELPTEQKEILAAAPTETSSEGLTHSDELGNTVLQNTTASVSQSSNSQITNHEQEPNDKLAGTITEPIMHVIDPCTEVPEPVGTPQTSRSKISESHGGDNGPELNVAHLVDAVDVREATEEDIPPLKPVTPKATQHVDRPKRPPPPVIMTAAHGISDNGEKTKKSHGGFHFRLGKSKSRENSSTREGSPDHHQRRTIGASMRSAFGTLTRSLKQKQSDLSGRKRTPGDAPINGHFSRPPPPGMDQIQATVQRHHQSDQEEQSLQSVSGVCLSHESSIHGSPSERRRQLIHSAALELQQALPPEDHMTEVCPIYVNHSMQPKMQSGELNAPTQEVEISIDRNADNNQEKDRVLSWTASSIANTNNEAVAQEDQIQPVHVERGRSQQMFISRLVTDNGDSREPVKSTAVHSPKAMQMSSSPKPPRPVSRPVLSPLDYQTFHSEDSLSQSDVVTRRADVIHAVAPLPAEVTTSTGSPYRVDQEQITNIHPDTGPYRVSASLDRRQYDTIDRSTTHDMRRTQTMRTADYAGRLRERLRTFRGDLSDTMDERGGTLRVTKIRTKPENYVCSETIHWPGKLLKLKRRQTTPPAKHVYSTPNEVIIPRPQPRATLSYHPAPSPQSPRSPLQENVSAIQTIHVQSKPPRSAPAQRTEMQLKMSPDSSSRQLTSLQTLAASPKAQRCTALPDSPQKGLMQVVGAALESPTQDCNVTTFPYLSKELVVQITQSDKEPRVDADMLRMHAESPLIEAGIRHIHPFLNDCSKGGFHPADNDAESKENESCAKTTIRNFLNTCVRLKSVDLQGHYAAFHYPLRAFNPDLWRSNARFVDWNYIPVVQEPGGITEYVELPTPVPEFEAFLYADKPIDALLTTWLDCHQTSPPSEVCCHSVGKPAHIYHPISFAVRLDQLLSNAEGKEQETMADTCFRLAALLSYAHCRKCLTEWNLPLHSITTDPKEVLVILSTCNCLLLFKKDASQPSDSEKSEANPLVKFLCASDTTIEQGIDNLIGKLEEGITKEIGTTNFSSRWLEAVAPPDWMALCCSRIHLKQK